MNYKSLDMLHAQKTYAQTQNRTTKYSVEKLENQSSEDIPYNPKRDDFHFLYEAIRLLESKNKHWKPIKNRV